MESQEKEVSQRIFFESCMEKTGTKHSRLKELMLKGITIELTDRQRECISMKYMEGMSAEDIARQLGITKTCVYKHIRKGIERLRKLENYI